MLLAQTASQQRSSTQTSENFPNQITEDLRTMRLHDLHRKSEKISLVTDTIQHNKPVKLLLSYGESQVPAKYKVLAGERVVKILELALSDNVLFYTPTGVSAEQFQQTCCPGRCTRQETPRTRGTRTRTDDVCDAPRTDTPKNHRAAHALVMRPARRATLGAAAPLLQVR